MLSLGEKVRRMRLKRKLTLVQLATLTKVSAVTIHNIERNIYEPKASTLINLSQALNTPLTYFIDHGPEGLFVRFREGESVGRSSRKIWLKSLPHVERLELEPGSESIIEKDPGRLLVLHLVFGNLAAVKGKRTIQLNPGDNLYVELFEDLVLSAREASIGVMVFYPED